MGEILGSASKPGESLLAAVLSFVTLLFGASGVFGQLQSTLNAIWEVASRPGRGWKGWVKDRFFSMTMVAGVGFLLLVSTVISTVLAALGDYFENRFSAILFVYTVINWVVSLGVTTVLFGLVYKYVPEVEISWRDVWVSSLATALLFTIGKYLIGLYLGQTATDSTYGAFGSLIALLAWVYYSAQILFLGAEFTQVYANRFGSHILAADSAVLLDDERVPAE